MFRVSEFSEGFLLWEKGGGEKSRERESGKSERKCLMRVGRTSSYTPPIYSVYIRKRGRERERCEREKEKKENEARKKRMSS